MLVVSPSPPSAAPPPACADRPPAAEDGPAPPFVGPAPVSPAPHVQPSLSPAAAVLLPGMIDHKDHTKTKEKTKHRDEKYTYWG